MSRTALRRAIAAVAVVLIAVGLTALVDGAQKARPESPVPKDIG